MVFLISFPFDGMALTLFVIYAGEFWLVLKQVWTDLISRAGHLSVIVVFTRIELRF